MRRYNREEIEKWLKLHDTSPLTGEVLAHNMLVPNLLVRQQITAWREQHGLPVPVLPTAPAAAAAAGPAPLQTITKPAATCTAHPREKLRAFCCDCGRAVCVLCAVDVKKCKAHATEVLDSLIDELEADAQAWCSARLECDRQAQQLCADIQANGAAKKQSIDKEVADLQQLVRRSPRPLYFCNTFSRCARQQLRGPLPSAPLRRSGRSGKSSWLQPPRVQRLGARGRRQRLSLLRPSRAPGHPSRLHFAPCSTLWMRLLLQWATLLLPKRWQTPRRRLLALLRMQG